VHLAENLFAKSVANEVACQFFSRGNNCSASSDGFCKSGRFLKDIVKPSNSKKGFLRWGFLNPRPAMKVFTPHISLLELVMSSSTLNVKEDGVVGFPSPFSGCVTPTIEKGDDFKVNDLSQSQKWPVGFGPSGEVVVGEQGDKIWDGEDGDSPYPLGVLPPNMALDCELDSVEDENPSLVILDAFEEDFLWEVKVARPKTKGKKGKAHVL